MSEMQQLAERHENAMMPMEDVKRNVQGIQNLMRDVMHEGEHFGKIPGCGDKPTLLKSGAEKLAFTFRLRPEYKIEKTAYDNGHIGYDVGCTLSHITSGQIWGAGVGSCSTLESKYRYRNDSIDTGTSVPRSYWDVRKINPEAAKELLGGAGFSTKKVDGDWHIFQSAGKAENENPADFYNTVLKMAKKRSFVDAVLTATAASDIFTQDLEDYQALTSTSNISPTATATENRVKDLQKKIAILASEAGVSPEKWKKMYISGMDIDQAAELINNFINAKEV